MKEIVIRIQINDNGDISTPNVDYAETPQEPEWAAPLPLPAPTAPAAPQNAATVPSCPQHGPMTFHPAKDKPDGKHISARYSCDVKINNEFCPTRPKWIDSAA